jgi:hypothetical protein
MVMRVIRTARADGAMLKMPVARYFLFVGAALLALLFVVDAYQPKLPVTAVTDAAADTPMIRIQSDRKWPERIVFDTSIAAVRPVQTAAVVPVQAPAGVADVSAKVREAFAQLQPSEAKPSQQQGQQPAASKTPTPAPAAPQKRKVAKKHMAPPMVLVAQQQQQRPFGFFGNNTW